MLTHAMILAAGRGERMRPLTDTTPKPMLWVAGKPLIQYHIEKLAQAGMRQIVINLAWLGEQIEAYLGDGSQFNVTIQYSRETEALETAGGIVKALPLLGDNPFMVVNGDVYSDLNYQRFSGEPLQCMARLLMVPNPQHNPDGDFAIVDERLSEKQQQYASWTFSGIGLYRPDFFAGLAETKLPLAPEIRKHMAQQQVQGQLFQGRWCDVGTPQRLDILDKELSL